MSKAPEWIYLDGDVEAGDGMFPRCFEDPKYASEPPIEYGRIDLLEAAEQRGYADAMEAERKLHEARIEELEAKLDWVIVERDETFALMLDRAQTAEAKLAKALRALEITDQWLRDLDMYANPDYHLAPSLQQVRTTLAELKGDPDA